MKKLFLILLIMGFSSPAYAKCIMGRHVPRTNGNAELCKQEQRIKQQQKQIKKRQDVERQAAQLEESKRALNAGYQSGNSGTVVNVGGGGGLANSLAGGPEGSNPLDVEAQFEIFLSSAIFELSPQQPGAKRQFLMGQNSGGTGLGVRYKFAKGVHLFAMYEKFRYKGTEFQSRDPSKEKVGKTDEFGNPVYGDDGAQETEIVTTSDKSYTWAGQYEHTRYAVGLGFRGQISQEQMLTWTFDVIPMGWFETNYVHEDGHVDTHAASKAYGFRASVNKHMSSDFSISTYYQLFDAQKEATVYADEYKPLGSQEFGVSLNFGLPNVMGVVF